MTPTTLFAFQMPCYMVCDSCCTSLLDCTCTKSERSRKRARDSEQGSGDSEQGSDERPGVKVEVG